jgi:hypothetical protein
MRLVPIERCADCLYFKGVHYDAFKGTPEEYQGQCTYPEAIYEMRIDGDTKFYDGFPAGCPLEEG